MSGEIDPATGEPRRRRPIPIFDDKFAQTYGRPHNLPHIDLSKGYLKKDILREIGNNLNELVDIKTGGKPIDSIIEERKFEKPIIEEKKTEIPIITQPTEIEIKIDNKKGDIKKDDVKIGISNIIPEKTVIKIPENKEAKQIENKDKLIENEKKIIRRKVKYMNNEETGVNISPEDRRRMRKFEMKEFQEEEEINKKIRASTEFAEQNKKELEKLRLKFDENTVEIQKGINNRFIGLDSKFSEMSAKLKEACDGIDCLKKDIKKFELFDCPECGKTTIPNKASFCPDCGAKIHSWTEDNGTPVKNWKPTWVKLSN